MLTFYRGSDTTALAGRLINHLRAEPPKDPLKAVSFVVQNHGMAQWLSKKLASETGIAANLDFQFPAEQVWDVYRSWDPSIPEEMPSDREPMTWTVYRVLSQIPNKGNFQTVYDYVRDDEGKLDTVKTWKLANKIADMFDRYQVYRPEMILEWEEGTNRSMSGPERWQAALWREVNAFWNEHFAALEWFHRPGIHRNLMEAFEKNKFEQDKLPGRLFIFGVSKLPPAFIELFIRISGWVDVHWFWTNPAEGVEDHPLYDSWGEEGRDFTSLIEQNIKKFGIKVNHETLPAGRQDPILKDPGMAPGSSRLQVHSCHNRLREVEVLYDRLTDLFEKDESLAPDDIIIQAPSIGEYAPYIEAVFGTPGNGRPRIPFYILDDTSGARKEVFKAYALFLKVVESRFKVTEVLDLLSNRAVLAKFDLSENDLDRCARWIEEANIRWGLNGEHKSDLGISGSSLFSWEFGLNRMMLGYAAQMEDNLFKNIYPLDRIESSDDAEVLGKLSNFVNQLQAAYKRSRENHSPREWRKLLTNWAEQFISDDPNYYRGFKDLTALIEQLESSAALGGVKSGLPFKVVRHYLNTKMEKEVQRGGYFGHGVTFCGLDPMRNIPFRVVGMIGMNNEMFPRNRLTPEFDLMEKNPLPADPHPRYDDRYLFLESLNASREMIYLSYIGQSNRDDSSRPPSVIISELLDYLGEVHNTQPGEYVQKHPLHPFSKRYFDCRDVELFTYSSAMYEVRRELDSMERVDTPFLNTLPEAGEEFKRLSIDDWIRFFQNPAKYLLQQRTGIYFREEKVISEAREPFELDNLERYSLGRELFQRVLDQKPLHEYEPVVRHKGMLPEGWPGSRIFQSRCREVQSYGESVRKLLDSQKLDPVEVHLEYDSFHISAVLDALYEGKQLLFRFGKLRGKDLIEGWLLHLALQKAGNGCPDETLYVVKDDDNDPELWKFSPTGEQTDKIFGELIDLYWKGMHEQLPLFAQTSYEYALQLVKYEKDHGEALRKAGVKWNNSGNSGWQEQDDPYIKLIFKNSKLDDIHEFTENTLKFWKPLMHYLGKVKEGTGG